MLGARQNWNRIGVAGGPLVAALVAAVVWSVSLEAQNPLSVTLSGTTNTMPFREYATRELGDAWDMSQRTDIGWFTWSADNPASNLTSTGIATDGAGNSFFRAQTNTSVPSFFLLDPWQPGSGKLGKVGVNHPIDTTIYNVLYVKVKFTNQVLSFPSPPVAQVFWSRDTIYYNIPDLPASTHPYGGSMVLTTASNVPIGTFLTPCLSGQPACRLEGGNWVVYRIPLSMPLIRAVRPDADHWHNVSGGWSANWGDPGVMADSLRFSPFNIPGDQVGPFQVDWARLVNETPGSSTTVSWTGGGTYDVVVSTQSNCSDFSVVGYSKSTGFQFQSQLLPPGTYRVGLRKPFTMTGHTAPNGSTLDSCSSATFTVGSYPSLSFQSPNPEGSSDDFATTVLGNPWDFDSLNDIDYSRNVNFPDSSFGIVSRAATDLNGNDLGLVRMFRNRSTPEAGLVGDPHIYPLWPTPAPPAPLGTRARGQFNRIDANKYRIMTAQVGVERVRDSWAGSVGRVIWRVDGDVRPNGNIAEIESSDIILRHLDPAQNGGKITLETIQIDMADRASLPVESDVPQSASGWNNYCVTSTVSICNPSSNPDYAPGINLFRFDFHEFPGATNSSIARLKLAALERTGSSFQIRWTASNPSALTSTVTLKAMPVVNPAAKNFRPADLMCSAGGSVVIASGISLSAGVFHWVPSATPGIEHGHEYYVCAQIFVNGVSGAVDEVMSQWPIVAETGALSPSPFTAGPSPLSYAATKSGAVLTSVTAPKVVTVSGPAQGWTAAPDQPWIQVTSGSGTGNGQFTVSIINPGDVIGTQTSLNGTVTINAVAPGYLPREVAVQLTVQHSNGPSAAPFGMVDTPVQGTVVQGSIGVTGWALDDQGVTSVRLYRNCLSFEPANCSSVLGHSVVYVGDAVFVDGARPDVAATYPTYPQNTRSGWGYLLLTHLLPNVPSGLPYGGEGPVTLYAVAVDAQGQQTLLGRTPLDTAPTSVTMANLTIAKPFGAIDTPAQGQTISGVFNNFGWALTPDLNTQADGSDIIVPTNGSTMTVFIDGLPVGKVSFNQCRGSVGNPVPNGVYCNDDVSSIFGNPVPLPPGTARASNPTKFRNLDAGRGAIGAYTFDSRTLADGLHTIVWSVTDSSGRAEGIGSRFFRVANGGPSAIVSNAAVAPGAVVGVATELDAFAKGMTGVWGRTGYDLDRPWTALTADTSGVYTVRLPQLGRVELWLGADIESGYHVAGETLQGLPVGASVDGPQFGWAPPPAYVGTYELVLIRRGGEQVRVRVTIVPPAEANAGEAQVRMHLDEAGVDTFWTDGGTRTVHLSGWAFDPDASLGVGIGAVHVWATREATAGASAGTPVFLGAATLGQPPSGDQAPPQAGFRLTGQLAPGAYTVTAYVWSVRTERWEDARTVRMVVR